MSGEKASSSKATTLKKGQACTCCRRRKTRCDGVRPICTQCSSNGRELDCEYSDGFGPTRTEILQEYLARLQNRVHTLEASRSQRGTRQLDQPSLTFQPTSHWWSFDSPPPQIGRLLFEIFLRHEHQVGWGLNTDHVAANLPLSPSNPSYPHPALANAIFLWGSRFSRSAALSSPEIEQTIFARATTHLQTQGIGSQNLQRGLQAVQAEILLATYLFVIGGRPIEADYHVTAAVRMALGFGMNRISPRPGVDVIEEGERISVFWKVFCLDRLWASANGKPATLQLQGQSRVVITTPWPKSPEEYAQGSVTYSPSGMIDPLRQFLEEEGNSTSGFSYPALIVKAALLCERSSHFAARQISDNEIRLADTTIFGFVSTLAALDGNTSTIQRARFVSIHATAYLAFIRLHERNAPNDAGAYSRCVQAARYISMLSGHFVQGEFTEMDPFSMPCFIIASKVLIQEISRIRQMPQSAQGPDFTPPNELIDELDRLMDCLAELIPIYPVIDSQLDTLHDMRSTLQI